MTNIVEHITDLRQLAEEMAMTAEGVPGMNLTLSRPRIARVCRELLARIERSEKKQSNAAGTTTIFPVSNAVGTTNNAVQRSAMPRWMPINSAPKEGSPVRDILLYCPEESGTGRVLAAHWAYGGGEEQPRFGPAWFVWDGFGFRELRTKPTYWMELPLAPDDWRRGADREASKP